MLLFKSITLLLTLPCNWQNWPHSSISAQLTAQGVGRPGGSEEVAAVDAKEGRGEAVDGGEEEEETRGAEKCQRSGIDQRKN